MSDVENTKKKNIFKIAYEKLYSIKSYMWIVQLLSSLTVGIVFSIIGFVSYFFTLSPYIMLSYYGYFAGLNIVAFAPKLAFEDLANAVAFAKEDNHNNKEKLIFSGITILKTALTISVIGLSVLSFVVMCKNADKADALKKCKTYSWISGALAGFNTFLELVSSAVQFIAPNYLPKADNVNEFLGKESFEAKIQKGITEWTLKVTNNLPQTPSMGKK